IESAGQAVEAVLTRSEGDEAAEDRYHPQVRSRCGAIRFEEPGTYQLSLNASEILPDQRSALAVVSCDLQLQPDP
ncbi:MAG: hypothetical protein JXC32_09890, partial [Anaerolineae bacterium]|nr:hypothetical protein [Anaerolineae bacterium]